MKGMGVAKDEGGSGMGVRWLRMEWRWDEEEIKMEMRRG